jgi:hypothetical protein
MTPTKPENVRLYKSGNLVTTTRFGVFSHSQWFVVSLALGKVMLDDTKTVAGNGITDNTELYYDVVRHPFRSVYD